MLEKTRGIVLKSHKYSETSLICKVFTDKFGVLSFLVPGIRSTKNKRGNILQTGQLLDIDFSHRENKNFQRFKEYKVAYIPINTFSDIKKSAVHSFIMELSFQLVKEGEENNELFEHLYNCLITIDQSNIHGIFPAEQLLQISKILGFFPSNNYADNQKYFSLMDGVFHSEKTYDNAILDSQRSKLIHQLLNKEFNFNNNERKLLLDTLLLYYQHHIPNFRKMRSIDILSEVMRAS